eukprot:IDg20955t1
MTWRVQLTRTVNWLRSRRKVGVDGRHTFYSEYVGRAHPEKRYVEYEDGDLCDSSHGMHTEWWAWLHNRRDEPPTPAEIAAARARADALQRRVQIIEEEDARQRLRQFAGATSPKTDEVRRERAKERLLRTANEKAAAGFARLPSSDAIPNDSTEAFKPEAWTPIGKTWRR